MATTERRTSPTLISQAHSGKNGGSVTTKLDWLLQLIGDDPIDPIRIQKGMFLFAMTAEAPQDQRYDFVPYNWGPCSFEIYEDLLDLLERGQIEELRACGASWHKYRRTATGHAAAGRVAKSKSLTSQKLSAAVADTRSSIQASSFDQLLKSVYDAYPEYATKEPLPRLTL